MLNMNNDLKATNIVSIITISYNSERSISRTINSVLNQDYKNIEYIIVDGGSTDKTLDIVKSFESNFIEKSIAIKWISEKDKGISDAFNKGITLASGEIIGIVNSDDWLEDGAVRIIIENLEKNISIYCGNLNLYDKYGSFIKTRKSRPSLLPLGMYIMHPTVFIKKEVYKQNRFDINLKVAMDFDLLLRLRNLGYKVKYIDRTISNMLQGGASGDVEKMRDEEDSVLQKNLSKSVYLLAKLKIKFEELLLKK